MTEVPFLPTLNAGLNASAALFLLSGWGFIKNKKVHAHRACMLSAFACSTVFLIGYLYYHYQVGSVRFQGQGPIRTAYFTILLTHTALALAVVPLVLRSLFLAWKRRWEEHRRWARVTMPLWLYVSTTGVVVYWMLYRL